MKLKNLKITSELIREYDPCVSGINQYDRIFPKPATFKEILKSKLIPYHDKLWLAQRLVPVDILEIWAIDAAFRVASLGEESLKHVDREVGMCVSYAYAFRSPQEDGFASDRSSWSIEESCRHYAQDAVTLVNREFYDSQYSSYKAGIAYEASCEESLDVLLYLVEND